MSTILYIILGAWLLAIGSVVCMFWRATSIETPRPTFTKEQAVWFKAAARVAHRRVA